MPITGSHGAVADGGRIIPLAPSRRSRPVLGRSANRRVVVQRRAILVVVADALVAGARVAWRVVCVLAKVLLVLGVTAGLAWGGRHLIRTIVESPRFSVHSVDVGPTTEVSRDEIVALSGVAQGEQLLTIDTDAVAGRIAVHPWLSSVRVSRRLPSVLRIDVVERQAAAVASLDGLYLIDGTGRPFKRATMAEAEGLPVLSGLDRSQYVSFEKASRAAFREALALLTEYHSRQRRPGVSEVNIDPRGGFTVILAEGGAQVRLGRTEIGKKLARFDQILEAVGADGASSIETVQVVHLDGPADRRVTVKFKTPGS